MSTCNLGFVESAAFKVNVVADVGAGSRRL
jgi:hypothetical protein